MRFYDLLVYVCSLAFRDGGPGILLRRMRLNVLFLMFTAMTKTLDYGSQGRYACILYDATFKIIVCNPRNEKLMIKIIELLLPGKHIDSIDFIDKEQHGLEKNEKGVTFRFAAVTAAPRKSK